MGLLDGIVSRVVGRSERIGDRDALVEFLDRQASFLCQKCVVEFCRVRAGVYWQKLFAESEFLANLDRSRWRSFGPSVAMLTEMTEAVLRPHAGDRRNLLPGVLESAAASVFDRYDVPPGEADDFWVEQRIYVHEQLQATRLAPPRAVKDMTKPSARRIFRNLPLHEAIVTNDFDYIRNNLRMNLIRAHDEFVNRIEVRALLKDLLGSERTP